MRLLIRADPETQGTYILFISCVSVCTFRVCAHIIPCICIMPHGFTKHSHTCKLCVCVCVYIYTGMELLNLTHILIEKTTSVAQYASSTTLNISKTQSRAHT